MELLVLDGSAWILTMYWSHKTNTLFLLKLENQPECIACQKPNTIRHIVMILLLPKLFTSNNVKDIFKNVCIDDILSFLK